MNLYKSIECQYLVGDSAFENDWYFVAAFNKLPNCCTLVRDQERFNNKLSKLRIISEHGIGMLKGRFPWLRSIRFVITEDIKSLKRILHVIDATIILHNMLVQFEEEEPEDWIDFDGFNRKSVTTLFSWMIVFIFLTVSILLITLFRRCCCCCLQTDSDKNLRSSMIASEHVSFCGIRNLKFPLLPFQARVGGTGTGLNLSSSNWRTTEEWSPRRSRAFSSATGLPLVCPCCVLEVPTPTSIVHQVFHQSAIRRTPVDTNPKLLQSKASRAVGSC
jgi:hypothetical protein